jgi:energy-coupling factor transporter ATP-binding protein EcfA2
VAYVHQQLLDAAPPGSAVLLISEDLDEIFALADRIAVMHHGRLSSAAPGAELDAGRHRPGDGGLGRGRRMRLERRTQASRLAAAGGAAGRGAGHAAAHLAAGGLGRRAGGPRLRAAAGRRLRLALRLTETLTRATPLILTGLAAAVAFRARLYNIGAEGQLYAGALAAVAVGGLHGGSGFEARPGCCSR